MRGRTVKKIFLLGFLVAVSCAYAAVNDADDVVLWLSVSPEATVEDLIGNTVCVSDYQDGRGNVISAARVCVTEGGVETVRNLYWSDGAGGWETAPDVTVMAFDRTDPGSYPAWQPVSLGGEISPAGQIALELGFFDASSAEQFAVLAVASETYQNLVDSGFISTGGVSTQTQVPWSPNYVVPEPTSGLLVLLGAACLALRRRLPARRASRPA